MSASDVVKRLLRAAGRYAADPVYRQTQHLRWRRPANLFQPHVHTFAGRYPRLFRAAREAVGDGPSLRLLSFGCATGEEVATLRRYFPQAFIKGIDINPRSIAACRPAPGVEFAIADTVDGERPGSCDAIFCLAVLRHGDLARDPPERCDHLIRFADFERLLAGFDRALKPGGVLALRHSNFRLEDSVLAPRFAPLMAVRRFTDTPKYGPDDRRLADEATEQALWRKRA